MVTVLLYSLAAFAVLGYAAWKHGTRPEYELPGWALKRINAAPVIRSPKGTPR